jgi:hypothetical protein
MLISVFVGSNREFQNFLCGLKTGKVVSLAECYKRKLLPSWPDKSKRFR